MALGNSVTRNSLFGERTGEEERVSVKDEKFFE